MKNIGKSKVPKKGGKNMEIQKGDNKLLRILAASKELGISMPTLRRLIRDGATPVHQLGGMIRVNVGEVITATLRAEAAN